MRSMGVLPSLSLSKRGSRETISGSGYRVGIVPVQSRSAERVLARPAVVAAAVARKERRFIATAEESFMGAYGWLAGGWRRAGRGSRICWAALTKELRGKTRFSYSTTSTR